MQTIGVLRHYFLPPSETFIYTSLRSLTRYRAAAFAIARRSAEKFPWGDVTALRSLRGGMVESWLYWATSWSPRYTRWARRVRLIHAHMGYTGPYALGVARRLGLPLVTSFYGKDVTLRSSRDRWASATHWHYWLRSKALFQRGDRFVVLSRHMADALAAQGVAREKLRVVPLGTDLARWDVPRLVGVTGALRVLMVGREVEKKGFDDGLRACARAREAGVDVRPVLLGTGEGLGPALQRLAAELKLEVTWPAPSTSVVDAMRDADVLLVPSRTASDGDQEGTPTVICEGSAARLPIVATRHAGIPEQVDDGVTGLLADERDVDGLAHALVELAGDPDRRLEMGRLGREKIAREYSLDAHRDKLQAVYDELLG